ncbi:GAF domain-containing protein [Paenibacillus donghaensis]|uniref:GAF domain-containing protein n=1 Tax=Paenibacillus donghaensis TaxID=414771 RepID=UPI0024819927|nr:GAF domain-containing protein [Paenibacillus donghaensis]
MPDPVNNEDEMLNRTLLTQGDFVLKEPIDLTNCDKEPIHIPGMIQPHGVLLAVTMGDAPTIVQCSRNTVELLGRPVEQLLGKPLAELLGDQQLPALQMQDIIRMATSDLQYLDLTISVAGEECSFTGIVHESEGLLILELELVYSETVAAGNDFDWIRVFFSRIKFARNRTEASQVVAEQVKEMLGYDRVMIYEFDEEWNGKVIAEAKEQHLEPFLGHHYPASDIPKQARALYLRNWLRIIVDVSYRPVEIVPMVQPLTGKPLNLSLSVLRSNPRCILNICTTWV